MTEKVKEQISALVDGELPESERALLVRRLATDQELRGTWERYHLIRDALRHELPDDVDGDMANRIMAAVEAEPPLSPQGGVSAGMRRAIKPLAGLAIAASVAALAIIGLQQLGGQQPEGLPRVATRDASSAYVQVAGTRWDLGRAEVESRLNGYLVNHNEYTSSTSLQGMLHYTRIAGYDAQQ